jgi:hypothetical protein
MRARPRVKDGCRACTQPPAIRRNVSVRRLSRSATVRRSLARPAGGRRPRRVAVGSTYCIAPACMTEYRPPRPRPDPISDVDPLPIALAWRERDTSPLLAAFAEIVRELAVPKGGRTAERLATTYQDAGLSLNSNQGHAVRGPHPGRQRSHRDATAGVIRHARRSRCPLPLPGNR